MAEDLQIRVHGSATLPTLIYLPGLHGDWTLINRFRAALAGRICFVEVTYPRTVSWTLEDYAAATETSLIAKGIRRGWLLGESFSSQVAWALLDRVAPQVENNDHPMEKPFEVQGVILAGGFVRYPLISGIVFVRWLNRMVPMWLLTRVCWLYTRQAKWRHSRSPEACADLDEFLERRCLQNDRQAILHRYDLILGSDFRHLANQARVPVYQLTGLVDPIVPWPLVRHWLRKHCPGYRGGKIFWYAWHNVLGGAPRESAEQILQWLRYANFDLRA